jgi:4'-phosphopantetheinyl transferase EntD
LPGEAEAVAKAVDRRRMEFAAGRDCARRALAELDRPAAAILRGPDRAPIWPPGIVGSITHNAGYCAAVVASDQSFRAIGIDAEPIGAVADDLADLVVAPEERTDFDTLSPPGGADWPTLTLCLKEAAYKAHYAVFREFVSFHDMHVRVGSGRRVTVQISPPVSGLRIALDAACTVRNGQIFAASWC